MYSQKDIDQNVNILFFLGTNINKVKTKGMPKSKNNFRH